MEEPGLPAEGTSVPTPESAGETPTLTTETNTVEGPERSPAAETSLSEEPDCIAQAEEAKTRGNELFKERNYVEAIGFYDRAIALDPTNKVYFSNRSFCWLKLEDFGFAESDAIAVIALDPQWPKGHYRQACAQMGLGHLDDGIKSLRQCLNLCPSDSDVRTKLNAALKTKRERLFAESISREETVVDPNLIQIEEGYTGLACEQLSSIDSTWVAALMENFKSGKPLHKKYAIMLIQAVKTQLERLKSVVQVSIPLDHEITVCGDVHGQFFDLCNIFSINGLPSPSNPYLFNGDFVDRGSYSVECILTLFAWKVCFPEHMHLTRGNHETRNMNSMYGFEGEVKAKYDDSTMDLFRSCFNCLPLAYCLNRSVLVLHGGLFSESGVTLETLTEIPRFREPPDEGGLMTELLWSDPCTMPGRHPSKRGVGIQFGPDIANQFLDLNSLSLLVRSHEVKDEGFEQIGRVITVFSAPNYCGQMKNKGAFIRFRGQDMLPQFTSFEAVSVPGQLPAMTYAKRFMYF